MRELADNFFFYLAAYAIFTFVVPVFFLMFFGFIDLAVEIWEKMND